MDRQQQVRIHLKRAINLPPDGGLFGSCTCDAYVVMQVQGAQKTPRPFKSKVVPFTLNPIWTDHVYVVMITETERERCVLHVALYDHNDLLPDELVGEVHIHLGELANGIHQQVHHFPLQVTRRRRRRLENCQVELAFDVITHTRTKETVELEAWENQRFSLLHRGWSKAHLKPSDPLPWTCEDGKGGGHHLSDVGGSAPSGFASRVGWLYDIRLGDDNGWLYARPFAGPWYNQDDVTMQVRQRRWINSFIKLAEMS
ncbi:unnamed protein product [Aphanomyces euteiches]